MKTHLRTLTKAQPVSAQESDNFNVFAFLNFVLALLQALDGLLMRKASTETQ